MNLMEARLLFSMLEQFSMLIAALAHDVGHPGLNNPFLTEVQHELAVRYNDRSPLENMHCCKLFEIFANMPNCQLFSNLQSEQYREARKLIIEVILHTDIIQHAVMVKELELLYEMNSKVFEGNVGTQITEREIEVLSENRKLVAKVVIHAADISNQCKPWVICQAW